MFPSRAGTDPLDGRTVEALLDELDICTGISREVLVPGDAHGLLLPARQRSILHLNLLQDTSIRGHRVLDASTVRQLVRDGDFDLVKVVEHIQLGQVQRRVVVDGERVAAEHEIEPAAATSAAGRHAELAADRLQLLTNLIKLLRREWPGSDPRRVRLDYADHVLDLGRVERESLDGAAQARRRRCHEWVCAVVEVQHECVRSLHQYFRIFLLIVLLQERELVDDERGEFFAVFLLFNKRADSFSTAVIFCV